MPPTTPIFLSFNVNKNNNIVTAIDTTVSIKKLGAKLIGTINDVIPNMNNILNTLLPTTLPMAISEFFFNEADTDVNNSGSDVPRATIVNPINESLNPACFARLVADDTANSLPKIIIATPRTIKINIFQIGNSVSTTSLFLKNKYFFE